MSVVETPLAEPQNQASVAYKAKAYAAKSATSGLSRASATSASPRGSSRRTRLSTPQSMS